MASLIITPTSAPPPIVVSIIPPTVPISTIPKVIKSMQAMEISTKPLTVKIQDMEHKAYQTVSIITQCVDILRNIKDFQPLTLQSSLKMSKIPLSSSSPFVYRELKRCGIVKAVKEVSLQTNTTTPSTMIGNKDDTNMDDAEDTTLSKVRIL